VIVWQFAWANNRILVGDDPALDTMNKEKNLEKEREVEERILHWMAKVHDILEKWQSSQNLRATLNEYCARKKQMAAIGYISNIEEIIKAWWTIFQHDGAAEFKLSERSPLPPALSPEDLLGGQTQIFNARQIRRNVHHPVESDEDSAPESLSDTEIFLNYNRGVDDPNHCEDDRAVEVESDIVRGNGLVDPGCPEQSDVRATPIIPGLIRPTWMSKRHTHKVLVMLNAMETRWNKGIKKK